LKGFPDRRSLTPTQREYIAFAPTTDLQGLHNLSGAKGQGNIGFSAATQGECDGSGTPLHPRLHSDASGVGAIPQDTQYTLGGPIGPTEQQRSTDQLAYLAHENAALRHNLAEEAKTREVAERAAQANAEQNREAWSAWFGEQVTNEVRKTYGEELRRVEVGCLIILCTLNSDGGRIGHNGRHHYNDGSQIDSSKHAVVLFLPDDDN